MGQTSFENIYKIILNTGSVSSLDIFLLTILYIIPSALVTVENNF
jgi:hypothetical protein